MYTNAKYTAEQRTTVEMDYCDFEELVKGHYGVADYSFVAEMECGNDTQHVWHVKVPGELDEFDQEELVEFADPDHERGRILRAPSAYVILQDLLKQGVFLIDRGSRHAEILTEAHFTIRVCW
jgi:hypothetical protein